MTDEQQRLLRAMLEAKREQDKADEVLRIARKKYLDAQAEFTGKFATSEHPLGPFVVGTTIIEQDSMGWTWPPREDVFDYREAVRCPTSD